MKTDKPKLADCPFCSGDNVDWCGKCTKHGEVFWVWCKECEAEGPKHYTLEEVIDGWGEPSLIQERNGRLRDALRQVMREADDIEEEPRRTIWKMWDAARAGRWGNKQQRRKQ